MAGVAPGTGGGVSGALGTGTPAVAGLAAAVAGAGAFNLACCFCQASHSITSEKLKMKKRIRRRVSMEGILKESF